MNCKKSNTDKKSDMNIGERVLVWGRQNGSWFSQSAPQHEYILIINCSVWAEICIKTTNDVNAKQPFVVLLELTGNI